MIRARREENAEPSNSGDASISLELPSATRARTIGWLVVGAALGLVALSAGSLASLPSPTVDTPLSAKPSNLKETGTASSPRDGGPSPLGLEASDITARPSFGVDSASTLRGSNADASFSEDSETADAAFRARTESKRENVAPHTSLREDQTQNGTPLETAVEDSVLASLQNFELRAAVGVDLRPEEQDTLSDLVQRASDCLAQTEALPREQWVELRDRAFAELRAGIAKELGADRLAELERPDRYAGPDLPPLGALRLAAMKEDLAAYELRSRLMLPDALRDLRLSDREQQRIESAFSELDRRLNQAQVSLTALRETGGALHPDAPLPQAELFIDFERSLAEQLPPADYERLSEYQAAWEATWMQQTSANPRSNHRARTIP